MTPPPHPPALTQEERALKNSRVANWIAGSSLFLSLVGSIYSGYQVNRTNDIAESANAHLVFFDSGLGPTGGGTQFYIKNLNKLPETDVYYTFSTSPGSPVAGEVFVGVLPACSSVEQAPRDGSAQRPGFTQVDLYFKDIDGVSWHRDASRQVSRTASNTLAQTDHGSGGRITPIEGGCG